MFASRGAIVFTMAAVIAVLLPVLGGGCGSEPTEYDKAAHYTPESLAQELVIRYRTLNPDRKTSKRGAVKRMSEQAIAKRNKADQKAVSKKTKNLGPTTIDDVLDDIAFEATLIKGTSPAEMTKKMIETISADSSLSDSEKKTLTELVSRLGD